MFASRTKLGIIIALACSVILRAGQIDIVGPAGSGAFGTGVTVLPNGTFAVTDPGYDAPGPIVDVGAVYLFSSDGTLISMVTGTTNGDEVGSGGVGIGSNLYWIRSPKWHNGTAANAGAVTWGNFNTGVSGVVSSANSLVGVTSDDQVGTVRSLTNGNIIVITSSWDNGTTPNVGAITWVNGTSGITGPVSTSNSLIGSSADDQVGLGVSDVLFLTNGNYVVLTRRWDNGAVLDVGAATWCNGSTGSTGFISPTNSLIGSTAGDQVGSGSAVRVLSNGNYVVTSPNWDNGSIVDAGAATWCDGSIGRTGVVSPANSLVGSHASDLVGAGGVVALTNGNCVINSPNWDNGPISNAGAVTWASGTTGITGVVTPSNSLVGSTASDSVGTSIVGVTALFNGHYIVASGSIQQS